MYKLLCGGAKFDVNTAANAAQFKDFCFSLAPPEDNKQLIERLAVLEKAVQGEVQFAGALDNPVFTQFVEAIRKFKPA